MVLVIWLVILFYLLGNMVVDYFYCCLEKFLNLLKLFFMVLGVIMFFWGNGAFDAFVSIVVFLGNNFDDVGLNSVLVELFSLFVLLSERCVYVLESKVYKLMSNVF